MSFRNSMLALLLSFSLVSCGKWWGEKSPPAGSIELSAKKSGCGAGIEVFSAKTDAESVTVFECWVKEIQKIWTQVYGETPDELSRAELKTLVKKGVLVLNMPFEEASRQIDSVFRILGFGEKLTHARMDAWVATLRENRAFIRRLYQRFTTSFPELNDDEIAQALRTAQSIIQMADWPSAFTLENLKEDIQVLLGLNDEVIRNIESAKLLMALDGDHFFQKILTRLNWLEKRALEIGHFYRSIVVRGEPVRVAGIGRFVRGIHAYLADTPIRPEATLSEVNRAATDLFALKKSDVDQMLAVERMLDVPERGFLSVAIRKSRWLGAHWDPMESVVKRLGVTSGDLIADAEISFLLDEIKALLQIAEIRPTYTYSQLLADLETLGAISRGSAGAASTYQQAQSLPVVFDLPEANYVPVLFERINSAQTLAGEIGHFYRSLALRQIGLSKAGIGRFLMMTLAYLRESSIAPGHSLTAFVDQVQVLFGLGASDRKQLESALQLGGIRLDTPGNLYEKILPRLRWVAPHWMELERVFTHLTPEDLFINPQGGKDFALLLEALRAVGWDSEFSYDMLERGLVTLGALAGDGVAPLRSARDFLDLNGTHLGPRLAQRLEYVNRRWSRLGEAYAYLTKNLKPLRFKSLMNVLDLAGELLIQLRWKFTTDEVLVRFKRVVPVKDEDVLRLLPPLLDLSLNVFAQLCPTFTTIDQWNAKEVGECFMTLPVSLKGGEHWFNMALNPIKRAPTGAETALIRQALGALDREFKTWVGDERRFPIYTRKVVAVAKALGAEPPPDFIDSLAIVESFGGPSTRERLFPSALSHSFSAFRRYQERVLEGLPVFVRAWKESSCKNALNSQSGDWGDCVPNSYPADLPQIRLALQLRNPNYGQRVVPLNGNRFAELMLFYTVAEEMILAFDKDKDGIIKAAASDEKNEVLKLMNVSVSGYDTLMRFADNVKNKLNGKPIAPSSSPVSFGAFDYKALTRVVTLFATDILVTRPEDESKNLFYQFAKLLESWTELGAQSALFMDQKGLAASVAVISGLTDFRHAWLKLIDPALAARVKSGDVSASAQKLARDLVIKSIPRYLEAHFPRTFASCSEFGYADSCGPILGEVLARGKDGWISQGDLDAISLFALGVEGLVDSCDYNRDNLLELDLFKWQDEVACTLKKSVNTVKRLIDAKIISVESEPLIQFALDAAKLHKLTQVFGKVALVKGESKWLMLNVIEAPFLILGGKKASIGSLYGLATDLAVTGPTAK